MRPRVVHISIVVLIIASFGLVPSRAEAYTFASSEYGVHASCGVVTCTIIVQPGTVHNYQRLIDANPATKAAVITALGATCLFTGPVAPICAAVVAVYAARFLDVLSQANKAKRCLAWKVTRVPGALGQLAGLGVRPGHIQWAASVGIRPNDDTLLYWDWKGCNGGRRWPNKAMVWHCAGGAYFPYPWSTRCGEII